MKFFEDNNIKLFSSEIWSYNATEIEQLFTYVRGNATILLDVVNYLDGNTTLIQKFIDWPNGNASLIDTVIIQLEQNQHYTKQ